MLNILLHIYTNSIIAPISAIVHNQVLYHVEEITLVVHHREDLGDLSWRTGESLHRGWHQKTTWRNSESKDDEHERERPLWIDWACEEMTENIPLYLTLYIYCCVYKFILTYFGLSRLSQDLYMELALSAWQTYIELSFEISRDSSRSNAELYRQSKYFYATKS